MLDVLKALCLVSQGGGKNARFANVSPNDSSIFKFAKQMDRRNQDDVCEICVRITQANYLSTICLRQMLELSSTLVC